MSKEGGFLQLRRGVFEHVRDGRMTMTEAFCYIYMLTQADTRTGIWNGSAGALAGELAFPSRTARNVLEALDDRYIRRFTTPGQHTCYPIALHRFLITDGEHKGEHLNALQSTSPIDLRYFRREQMGEQDGEHIGQQMATQKRIETRNKKQPPSPSAPLIGFEAFWKEYPKHEAKKKAEAAWRRIPLSEHPAIMTAVMSRKQTHEWLKENRKYVPHAATFLNQERWKDASVDVNSDGPAPRIPRPADCRPKV